MSQDPIADAYLAAGETVRRNNENMEQMVRAWVRDEIIRILAEAEGERKRNLPKRSTT